MTPENKKIAMYLGGAIAIGAVGFFVYSFFKKPIVIGNTSVVLGNEEDTANKNITKPTITPATEPSNFFKEMLAQQATANVPSFSGWLKDNPMPTSFRS
jgi:hypothetical protein